MATKTHLTDHRPSRASVNGLINVFEVEIDFSAAVNIMADGDVLRLFTIPAKTILHDAWAVVTVVDGETSAHSYGDSGSASRFSSTLNLNSANALTNFGDMFYYATASYILLTATGSGIENAKAVFGVALSGSNYALVA